MIRHAVSIDERRAKFRSDLISEAKTPRPHEREEHHRETHGQKTGPRENLMSNGSNASQLGAGRFRRRSQFRSTVELNKAMSARLSAVEEGYLDPRGSSHGRLPSTRPAISRNAASDGVSITASTSIDSLSAWTTSRSQVQNPKSKNPDGGVSRSFSYLVPKSES